MGLPPLTGAWKMANRGANDMAGARKWGTGNNPVHSVYGEGPPLRSTGRFPGPDDPTPEISDIPPELTPSFEYGYTMDDINSLSGSFVPFTPGWGTETTSLRAENWSDIPDWGTGPTDEARVEFGLTPELAEPMWRGIAVKSFPTETVTEGWENKTSGKVLAARTSDPSQYERQTSMQQVNPVAGRNNDAAVLRGTDDPRANILTRLTGMKIKPWSQGQRNEDMFPFQSTMMVRPFSYRTAATGNPSNMAPNEMYVSDPIERQVPPDPDLGSPENANNAVYGYTDEDIFYG